MVIIDAKSFLINLPLAIITVVMRLNRTVCDRCDAEKQCKLRKGHLMRNLILRSNIVVKIARNKEKRHFFSFLWLSSVESPKFWNLSFSIPMRTQTENRRSLSPWCNVLDALMVDGCSDMVFFPKQLTLWYSMKSGERLETIFSLSIRDTINIRGLRGNINPTRVHLDIVTCR